MSTCMPGQERQRCAAGFRALNSISEAPQLVLATIGQHMALQVAEWVLADARAAWCAPDWQQRLASCAAFLDSFMPLSTSQQGAVEARPPVHVCSASAMRATT